MHAFSAPFLFPAEIRNALLMLERRRRLERAEVDRALANLGAYGVAIEPPPSASDYGAVFELARGEQLTVYDAVYLWQTVRGGFTLASRDSDLLAAASRNGAPIRDVRL
jgi:predicted nucleic acid-binding protein